MKVHVLCEAKQVKVVCMVAPRHVLLWWDAVRVGVRFLLRAQAALHLYVDERNDFQTIVEFKWECELKYSLCELKYSLS